MLEAVAPRPWARRMLAWHILETTGALVFMGGRLTEHMTARAILESQKGELLRRSFFVDGGILRRAKEAEPNAIIEIERSEPEFPLEIPVELALQLEHFDWEAGTARGGLQYATLFYIKAFEELHTQHEDSWLECNLSGLSFDLSEIEMLAPVAKPPTLDLVNEGKVAETKLPRTAGPGRRRVHDWDGALLYLIGEAERNAIAPDPEAHGAQANLVKMLADWFAKQGSAIPSNSQLQEKAKRVLQGIRAANPTV